MLGKIKEMGRGKKIHQKIRALCRVGASLLGFKTPSHSRLCFFSIQKGMTSRMVKVRFLVFSAHLKGVWREMGEAVECNFDALHVSQVVLWPTQGWMACYGAWEERGEHGISAELRFTTGKRERLCLLQ